MSLRAVVVFVVGLLAVRLAATRAFGKWGALDIIFAVVVGSNLSRTLTGSAPFVPTLCATLVLVGMHALLARAATRWEAFGRIAKGVNVCLIREGEVDKEALRRQGLGMGDLSAAIRSAGYPGPEAVQSAYLERNGDISIIPHGRDTPEREPTRKSEEA